MKYHPRTKPFPHQAKATVRTVKHRNYALWMEPRTGKSKAILDAVAIHALRVAPQWPLRVAVLGPKICLDVWDDEIRKHFSFPAELEDHVSAWTRNAKREGPTVKFYLLGYERLRYRVRRKTRWVYPYLMELEAWNPDIFVLDESHRLKRPGGVTAQALWRLVARARKTRGSPTASQNGRPAGPPYVIEATGTPTPRGEIDAFAQFRILDEAIFGTNVADFEADHVVYGHGRRRWTIIKYRGKKRLHRKIRENSYAVSVAEAGLERAQFNQVLKCTLPPNVRRQYDELAEYFITRINDQVIEGKNSGAIRTRLLQVTGGFTTDGVRLHDAKLGPFTDWMRVLLEQEDSVLVYCRFSPEVAACVDAARRLGFRAYPYEGATSDRDRRMALKALSAKPVVGKPPVCIVFQIQTGSLSIDLSSAAEVVYYSVSDGWEPYYQSRSRVLGPNQRSPVRYTHLVTTGTIDRPQLTALQRKEDTHALMVRSPRRYLMGL